MSAELDKWRVLHQADAQYAAIRQALREAQDAIEQALSCARTLDPDAELTSLHQTIQDIDYAITDIAAETHDLAKAIRRQQDIIDDLHRQRDEAYRQRDRMTPLLIGRRKRK